MARWININRLTVLFVSMLLISEILVIRQNLHLKNIVARGQLTSNLEISEANAIDQRILEGKCLPFLSGSGLGQTFSSKRYLLLFCFSLNDCSGCLEQEVEIWNEFHESLSTSNCQVVGLTDSIAGKAQRRVQFLNIHFPVICSSEFNDFLQHGQISTPALIFVDLLQSKIIYTFFASPTNKSNDWFIDKITVFLNRCQQ